MATTNNNQNQTTTATAATVGQNALGPSLPKPSLKGYLFGNLAGKGTYGYVFRANKLGPTKDVVAVKCILLNSLSKTTQNNVINEISILKELKHKFIVQMIDFQWDKNFIYLIFEFCPGGELATVMHLKRCFPEEIVQHFLQQLASALKFLRLHQISHMDLKPQNILISGIAFVNLLNELNSFKVWRNVVLKIADFGFAQHLSDQEISTSFRGSPLYMAPEILLGHEYDARVDLWSIGVILYQCLFGRTPYSCSSADDLVQHFRAKKIKISIPAKPKISSNCRDILKRLLEFDPKMRLSFDAFFVHPFIDLEHMPTTESYDKASKIIAEAVREEKRHNNLQAFYLYRDAIFYMMPLYKWGDLGKPYDSAKQEALKERIAKYMERAESLQQKCGLKSIDPTVMSNIQDVYNLIDAARESDGKNMFEQSMQQYERAIEKSLKILKKADDAVRREFFGDINNWMSEAETVKMRLMQSVKLRAGNSGSLKLHTIKSNETAQNDQSTPNANEPIVSASTALITGNSQAPQSSSSVPPIRNITSMSLEKDPSPTSNFSPPNQSKWRRFISSNNDHHHNHDYNDQNMTPKDTQQQEPNCNIQ